MVVTVQHPTSASVVPVTPAATVNWVCTHAACLHTFHDPSIVVFLPWDINHEFVGSSVRYTLVVISRKPPVRFS